MTHPSAHRASAGSGELDHLDLLCLRALDNDGYRVAADVGSLVWPYMSRASASQAAAHWLKKMETRGLVERAPDGEKPIIWRRTSAGRTALTTPTAVEPGSEGETSVEDYSSKAPEGPLRRL